jgi:uncharacterized protein (DUF983 family)
MEDQENQPKPVLNWLPDAHQETAELHAGDICPRCRNGTLDYDGLLNLACPQCGYSLAGCFT